MNREEIKQYLPHRDPMLLVDEAFVDANNVSHGQYTVPKDAFYVRGHFPGHPVVPGVILCEIMGQCSSLLVKDYLQGRTPFYSGIDNARFKSPVYPGDTLEVTARIVRQRQMIFFVEATATVNNKLCVKADLSFALVDNAQ